MPEATAPATAPSATRAPATDLFSDALRWHEKFLPPVLRDGRLLLAGERETLVLGSAGVLALDAPLRQGMSLAAHCASTPGAPVAQMLHALDALLRQGLVQPVAQAGAGAYLRPDFSVPPLHVEASGQADAIVLTRALDGAAAREWAAALAPGPATEAGLTVVFCDDYLDPRLEAIDARQRARGRPWMLVRPAGEQAMTGPLFAAPGQQAPAACWHCLAHRWRRNHPARAANCSLHGKDTVAPLHAQADLIAARLKELLAVARRMLERPGEAQAVWSLAPMQRHPVITRPQCPCCGTPDLVARRQRDPIRPSSRARASRTDGGWRTMQASATIERLSDQVSPLTGVIARVVAVNTPADGGLTVYRSEISRTAAPQPGLWTQAWTQLCLGKGLSEAQARASAMCEAIERYTAFHQGDEAVVIAPAGELDARSIAPAALARFSDRQRSRLGTDKPPHAVAVQESGPAPEPTWWAPAWSLSADERCYLPLAFCLAHAPAESQHHVNWTSNGCAAGNTLEEAILQGFMELVERDAAAIWWYGRIRRPGIALEDVAAESRLRLERSCGPQWTYWLLDITHDFGIPVVVAAGRHAPDGQWAVGFGCSLDLGLACERALTEMSQLIAAQKSFSVDGDPAFLHPLEDIDARPLQTAQPAAPLPIAEAISHCVAIAAGLGLETLVYNHSRPDIPLHTVKVVVPGLCHIWPELGNPRLYDVPVALGWRSEPMQECDLNPQALYV